MPNLSGSTRRNFLKLVSALAGCLPVVNLKAGDHRQLSSPLAFYLVKNQHSATGVQAETIVLANPEVSNFTGDGYYLYPAWGTPAIYNVRQDVMNEKHSLVFYFPGSNKPLWKMAISEQERQFGGRVEGLVENISQLKRLKVAGITLRNLTVPVLPDY
ncbi:MAG: twin-arginine translocation signal domain-containing protein [Gammaproteobacteria bacterium]|nr:twin-arginine translocation signal domain-containing protein [Gammaproteobacteria bacterium]